MNSNNPNQTAQQGAQPQQGAQAEQETAALIEGRVNPIDLYEDLEKYSFSTVFPDKGEEHIDYVKALSKGMTGLDIEAMSAKTKLPVKIGGSMDAYKEMFPNLNEEELTEVYLSSLESYKEYREGNYSKTVSNVGLMPDNRLFKHLNLSNAYSSDARVRGSVTGHRDVDGFTQFLSGEQAAMKVGLAYDPAADVWVNINRIKDRVPLALKDGVFAGQPEHYFEIRSWDEDLSQEQILSHFGVSKMQKSNAAASFGKGLWESTFPALGKALAWTIDKPADLVEWISTGEITGNKSTDRLSNYIGNTSGTMTHRNVDEMQGAFDSWQSFALNLGTVVGQLATMRGVGGVAFSTLKGVSPMLAQKTASIASMGQMAAYMSYELDQELGSMGWSEEMRTTLSMAAFPIIFASEKFIGANNITNFLKNDYRQIQKAIIADMPKGLVNSKGQFVNKAAKATFLEKVQQGTQRMGQAISKYADAGNIPASMFRQGVEESLEEFSEQTMEIALKTLGDHYLKHTAQKTHDYYAGALFDDDKQTITYGDGRVEKLFANEYLGAKDDFEKAKGILERKDGLFDYSIGQWLSESAEASAMGFIGGNVGGAMFGRSNAKNKNEKDLLFQKMAIKIAEDQKYMSVVEGAVKRMMAEGVFGRSDIDEDGESIAKSGKPSQAATNAKLMLDELQINVDLAREFDIANPVILKMNGGDRNMLNELFELKKQKKELETEIQAIPESKIGEDEKSARLKTAQEKIEAINKDIERYHTTEEGSKFSQAYNDRAKEMIGSFKFAERFVMESFNAEYGSVIENLQEEYSTLQAKAQQLAQNIQQLKSTPVDQQTSDVKKQIKNAEKELADLSKQMNKQKVKIDEASKEMVGAFDKFKKDDPLGYWKQMLNATGVNFHYKDYRAFVESGDLDSMIEAINKEREAITNSRSEATENATTQLEKLIGLQGRLEGLKEWNEGKGLKESAEFKAILSEIGGALQAINSINSENGFNSNLRELRSKLTSLFSPEFFQRINQISNREMISKINEINENIFDLDVDPGTTLGDYKALRGAKDNNASINAEIARLNSEMSSGNLTEEESANKAQQIEALSSQLNQEAESMDTALMDERIGIYEQYGSDADAIGSIIQNAASDAHEQAKFSNQHLGWVGGASSIMESFSESLDKSNPEDFNILSRENLTAQDWMDIYLKDISERINSMKAKQEDIADPRQAIAEIEDIIKTIAIRQGNILFQGAFDEMQKNDKHKQHLTKNVDYPIDFNEALMMTYRLRGALQDLESLKMNLEAIAGSRSVRQLKANAKNLEYQRLSLQHILLHTGDLLGAEFKSLVESIGEVQFNSENAADIEKSIAENESAILKARQILFSNRDKIMADDNFKKLFYSSSGRFLFLDGRENTFRILIDQQGVDYLNDDFNPGKTITEQRGPLDKTSYMVFMTFLEETMATDPYLLYSTEKLLLERAKNSNNKVASAEQMMSIRQTVSFMGAGQANVMKKLSYLIVNNLTNKSSKDATKKSTDGILFNALFMRGNPGVGKTNVMLPMAIQMHMEINNIKSMKIRIVDPTGDIEQRLSELNASFNGQRKITLEVMDSRDAIKNGFNEDYDMLVWDEASVLKNEHIDKVKNSAKSKPVIFLGDEAQMQSIDETGLMSPASKRMYRTTPISTSYRSSVYQIDDLRNAFRHKLVNGNESINFPKLFSDLIDGKRVGAKYMAGEEAILADFLASKNKSKALIFLRIQDVEDFKSAIDKGVKKVSWDDVKNHVYVLETNLEIDKNPEIGGVEIKSIQGMSVDEAYVNISFNDLGGIGNKTLPGRAGLTAVSRARNYVSLIGPTGMNMNSSTQVVWNPNPLQGQSEEQLAQQQNNLELERANRLDSLNNALKGMSVAETGRRPKSQMSNEPAPNNPPKRPTVRSLEADAQALFDAEVNGAQDNAPDVFSDPSYDAGVLYLLLRKLREIRAKNNVSGELQIEKDILKSLSSEIDQWVTALAELIFSKPNAVASFNENRRNLYEDFKDRVDELVEKMRLEQEQKNKQSKTYLPSVKNVQVKTHEGHVTVVEIIPGMALINSRKKHQIVQEIYEENGQVYVVFAGHKRPIKVETLKSYKLPEVKNDPESGDRMHNRSALNFDAKGAFHTSTATIMEQSNINLTAEEVEALRGIKADFLKKFGGKSTLVYHPTAKVWTDKANSMQQHNHVFLVMAKKENALSFLMSSQNPLVKKIVATHGLDAIANAISVIGSFNQIEIDYFTSANLSTNPTSAELDSLQQQIENGFQTTNTEDQNRKENINLNLARLAMLRQAISSKKGAGPVELGSMSLQDEMTIGQRVIYDFKGAGRSFESFMTEQEKKRIKFFLNEAQARKFKRKDGTEYWAYEVPFQGSNGEKSTVIVTMPSFSMIRNEGLNASSVLSEFGSSLSDLRRSAGSQGFFSDMNKSIIGRMLQSNRKGLIEMINKSEIVHEFLEIKNGEVELKGENDSERIDSAKALVVALEKYLKNDAAFSGMGKIYLPFDKTSPLLRTKATMIAQPQMFYTPDFKIAPPVTPQPSQTEKVQRAPRGSFLNRTENERSSTDPKISESDAKEIIRSILGDKFAESSLEFENNLGALENLRILGLMANGKIKMLLEEDGIRSRTPKHEALHVVFNYMISPSRKAELLEYGRKRRSLEKGVDVDKVSDIEAEEWLADDYAYRGNASVKRTKNNRWNRFVNYVARIAHSVGLFKTELDYLYWQMDRGVFRDAAINNADNIVRYSLEEDASEVEGVEDTKKKYDSTMLLRIFGDMKSVERLSFFFAQEVYAHSPLSGYKHSRDFTDAIRLFERFATDEKLTSSVTGDMILQSTGKALKDTLPSEVKIILNNQEDAYLYFDYVMQNKDIRDAMIEKTFPGLDVDTLEYRNAGEDTISDDKSLKDFRKKTNDFIRLAIRTTPFFSFSIDENGNIVKGEASGFVDFEDLQNSLIMAGIELRKLGSNFREHSLDLFIDRLKDMALKNGVDSRRGRNILSFVNRLTTLDPNGKGVVDLLKESNDPVKTKFINEFVNGLLSTYVSLYQKEVSDFSVNGYNNNDLRIRKLSFEGSNENKFKKRLKHNVDSFVMQDNAQVKPDVYKKLNKQFQIDESGLKLSDGTRVISKVGDRYVFEDHKDLTIITRSIMSHLGLSIFLKRGLSLMMRDNDKGLHKNKSPFKHVTELISKVNESKVGSMTPKEFMADNLMRMVLAVNHNHDFFDKVENASKKLAEGEELTKEQLNTIHKNSDHYEILDGSLRNVDDAMEDSGPDGFNYKVFKPTDFYKFFQVLGEVKAQTTTYGGMNFFYRPDGRKEYLFGLSSGFFENFSNSIVRHKQALAENELVSKNLLLKKHSPYTVSSIEEIKGIKQADIQKGITNPNTSDLLTIGINAFLDSIATTQTRHKMTFMNTNISDSGYMYATTYEVSNYGQMFIKGVNKNDFRNAIVNDGAINEGLKSVYEKFAQDHTDSVNRWLVLFGQKENTTGEILPREAFLEIDKGSKTQIDLKKPLHEELARINNVFMQHSEEVAEALREAIMNSDLVLNRDYTIKGNRIQFGKATSGNIDLETGKAYSIYNINNANQFLSLYESVVGEAMYEGVTGENKGKAEKALNELIKFRREVFGKEYFNFVNMMNRHGAKISKDYMMPKSDGSGVFGNGYALAQTPDEGSKSKYSNDWNPVLEAYFMGYHIMNTSFNELWLGTQFQYGGLSTADMSKRSKPFTTPGITAGRIDPLLDPDGMGASAKVVVISDEMLTGMGFNEDVYNTNTVATDGIGWANPLFYMFMDHSFGGRFSTMDKGMRKPITSYNNPVTGVSIQLKQAEHVLSYDVFSNSTIAERMFKEMLEMTQDGLSDVFMGAFERAGGYNAGKAAWDHAMNETAQFVKDNNLHNKLVWQFINPSAIKTGIHRVNKYSLDGGFIGKQPVSSLDIDTKEIRMVLNPYQDFNDNERMAPPTQMLAIMGIGQQNSEKIGKVNNNLSKIFDKAFGGIIRQLEKNPDEYITRLLERAIQAMPTFGNFAEMISNPNISLNLPQLTEKAQQIISNNITKEGTKRKYAGLRANQAPGSILEVYEKDGQVFMLSDLRKNGLNPEGYSRRKLRPMTKDAPAEVIVPFSYMAKFSVKPTESLQDIYTIKLNTAVNGKTAYNFNINGEVDLKGLKEFIKANYDNIDIENTPLLRAMNKLAERDAGGPAVEEDLEGASIGAQISNFQMLQELRSQLSDEIDYKSQLLNNLERVDNYYNALDESLNMFAVRIPTSNLGSGFRGRVVGFVNDMGNTIYTSELKNIVDGSDYDIDQLSIFLKFVNSDFTLPGEGSIKSLQNEIVQTLMDVYKTESGNDESIYNQLSLDKLSELADEFEKKTEKVVNDPGHNADDYTASMQGSDSIDRFANLSSVYSYISQLSVDQMRNIIPWAVNGITNQGTGESSIIHRLGLFLNSSTDNAKVLINGRFGVTRDATNIVGAMLLSGYDEAGVGYFLQNDVIKKVFELVEKGSGVTESAREFDPYKQTRTMLKNIQREINDRELNADMIEPLRAQKEALEQQRDAYAQGSQYFDKRTKTLKKQFFEDKETSGVFSKYNKQISEVSTNLKYLEDYATLTQLKDFLVKGESLKRIAHVVSLRKGVKAVSSDFDFYYESLSAYMGMDVKDFAKGKAWTLSDHLSYFGQVNNEAAYGTKEDAENAIDFEKQVASMANITELVRKLPHFNSYAKGLAKLKTVYENQFLLRNETFTEWSQEYLAGQERTTFLSKSHRSTFFNELGKFFLSIHFKNNFKNKPFDLGLHNSGLPPKSILKSIDISTPEGRNLYALQFPQFIMAMKNADNINLFQVQGGRDYSEWADFFAQNEFLERLGLNDNNERSYLILEDNYNLTENNIYKLRSEYEKLPLEMREMFEIYSLITNGFNAPSGSINDVMGTSILEGVSATLDKIHEKVKSGDPEVEKWRKSFLKVLPHAEGMSRYYGSKDQRKGTERETVLRPREGDYSRTLRVGRKVMKGVYEEEYLRVGKLGIPYDPDLDMTASFEPLLGLSSLEIDSLMNNGSIVKQFVRPHNYLAYYDNKPNFYVLPNGSFVRLNMKQSSKTTAVFEIANTEEALAVDGRVMVYDGQNGLKTKENGQTVYTGRLTKDVVSANPDMVFVIEGYQSIANNNFAQRNEVRALDNSFDFIVRKTQSGRHNIFRDEKNGVNPEFKNLVDNQVAKLKEAAEGKTIVFPENGFSKMSELETKMPFGYDYLTKVLASEFGVDFNNDSNKAPSELSEQEKSEFLKDAEMFEGFSNAEEYGFEPAPFNADEILAETSKAKQEGKENKNNCAIN